MEQLYLSGIKEAKPNAFNYNALISAWANCEREGSAERAKNVLERMEQSYLAGDKDVKPTVISFNAVIDAYAKAGKAQKAEELLRQMGTENLPSPNTRSFNSVINAWAKSRIDEAAMHAEELLDLMEKRYEEGNNEVRPDVHSFCTVINGTWRFQWDGG
jgi:pentatricopeptide repeat protein